MTYRQFVDASLNAVRNVGKSFTGPDDDWAPMALLDGPHGIVPAALSMEFFASDATKDALVCEHLPALIRSTQTRKLALVLSAWMSVVPRSPEVDAALDEGRYPSRVRPSQDPNRQEIVSVSVYDAERAECHIARILRDGQGPPRLAKWSEAHIGPDELGGRFVDSRLLDALR
jgi:hypothetical protein